MWRSAPLFVYESRYLVEMSAFTVIQDDSAMVVLAIAYMMVVPFNTYIHSLTFYPMCSMPMQPPPQQECLEMMMQPANLRVLRDDSLVVAWTKRDVLT